MPDDTRRYVGNQVETPITPQEKSTASHSLTQDDQVAAAVTSVFLKRPEVTASVTPVDRARVVEESPRDEHVATTAATNLLRRPDVAFKAMSDDHTRFQVNHAQNERSRQAREHFEDTSPVAPAVRNIDRTVEFLDLVTACRAFVATAGRTVPGLRDRTLSEDEGTIVHQNIAKVRATWTGSRPRKGPWAAATVIDSQSVKAAETVSRTTLGYDAGKKINVRTRHVVVDTRGLMVMVTPASLSGRDAAKETLFRLRLTHPEITIVWADSAYAGKVMTWAKRHLNLTIKPVSRPKDTSGFIVPPRRWVVERSLACMMHARRHARDCERLIQRSETLITWAAITLMSRRLARNGATPSRPRKPMRADG